MWWRPSQRLRYGTGRHFLSGKLGPKKPSTVRIAKDDRFLHFDRVPSGMSNLLPLGDSRAIYQRDLDSCGTIRHQPEQNLLLSSPSLVTLLRITLERR
jgi:hypothetical protein